MRRIKQRGSAMLVTMIVIAALLAGVAILASMQVSSGRSTELTRTGMAAFYCAESGLSQARAYVAINFGNWDAALAANCADANCNTLIQPAWLDNTKFSHDIDGLPGDDFQISIRDNDDEPVANGADDIDDKVFIVSWCLKYPDAPRKVEELIHYKPALNNYVCQGGGAAGRGNDNDQVGIDCSGN